MIKNNRLQKCPDKGNENNIIDIYSILLIISVFSLKFHFKYCIWLYCMYRIYQMKATVFTKGLCVGFHLEPTNNFLLHSSLLVCPDSFSYQPPISVFFFSFMSYFCCFFLSCQSPISVVVIFPFHVDHRFLLLLLFSISC